MAGLHRRLPPWLHEREIAVLGSDGISDPMPGVATPGLAVPDPPDRHHGDRAAPDRQHGARPRSASAARRAALGVPLHDGAPAHRAGTGLPGQPGRGPVSGPDELRRLLQRYARAADERDLDALAALFHPDASIDGTRAMQPLDEWLDTMRGAATFPTSMHVLGDPLIDARRAWRAGTLDTYAVVYQLGDTRRRAGATSRSACGTSTTVVRATAVGCIRARVARTLWMR